MGKRVVIATVKVEPGKLDEYLPLVRTLRDRSVAEQPGTLQWDILIPHDQQNVLKAFNIFADEEAISAFENGAPMTWINEAATGIVREITVEHFDLLD